LIGGQIQSRTVIDRWRTDDKNASRAQEELRRQNGLVTALSEA
jgi:hypothetical protein